MFLVNWVVFMKIHLDFYLFYLEALIKASISHDSIRRQDFINIVQTLKQTKDIKKDPDHQLSQSLNKLFTCSYQPYAFPINSLESAQFAMIYYLILQVFNHQHHQNANLFTDQLMSEQNSQKRILYAPQILLKNLKEFYCQSDAGQRKQIFNLLADMIKHWNCHFLRELNLMFWVWENEHLTGIDSKASEWNWPEFNRLEFLVVDEKPLALEPYTIYQYTQNQQKFFAFKTWCGVDIFDQALELNEQDLRDSSYWLESLKIKPPFPYLGSSQMLFCKQFWDFLNLHSEYMIRTERESLIENIDVIHRCFIHTNYLLDSYPSHLADLNHQLNYLARPQNDIVEINRLFEAFTQHYRLTAKLLARLAANIQFLDNKLSSIPLQFQAPLLAEIERFRLKLDEYQGQFSSKDKTKQSFEYLKMKAFNRIYDFSFTIKYTPENAGKVLRDVVWGVGLTIIAMTGFSILAASPAAMFGPLFAMYIGCFVALTSGLFLGGKALLLAFKQIGQDLSPKEYELLPSGNSP